MIAYRKSGRLPLGFETHFQPDPRSRMKSARLAVDIGGTFTDLALEAGGKRTTAKVLTTQAAPEQGVMEGFRTITQAAGIAPGDIELIIHGTTLATNAI